MKRQDPLTQAAILIQQAIVWHQDGKIKDAEAAYRRALALDPVNADALNMLGLIHHDRGDRDTAVRLIRASIAIKPTAAYWYNLAIVFEGQGDIVGALAAFRQAAVLDPSDVTNWSSAIFAGDLHPYSTPAVRLADRRTFNQVHCAALTARAAPHQNTPDPDRRLRVGYLSADFTDHSAALVFEPLLTGHDHDAVEVYLYWQQRGPADAITERFKGHADHWRVISGLSDEALAAQIRADGIDILVDLSGYSNGHRLLTLARKPAPIIMTGWGHATGLGIDACDYLLVDAITVPPEREYQHHERVLRLPCALTFNPRPPYPDVALAPSARNGYVTFGYLGRASKLSEPVWGAWATILYRVPGSRLVFKGHEYADQGYRARTVEFFASLRIGSHRLDFRGATDRRRHLETYADIDIALDPFPHGGGVTMLEACLMGVPSVTLLGDHLNGRIGASVLATIGLGHLVAVDAGDYVDIAARLAQTTVSLHARQSIRAALLDSIICNPTAYAASVEQVYRDAWKAWCAEQDMAVLPERTALSLVGV